MGACRNIRSLNTTLGPSKTTGNKTTTVRLDEYAFRTRNNLLRVEPTLEWLGVRDVMHVFTCENVGNCKAEHPPPEGSAGMRFEAHFLCSSWTPSGLSGSPVGCPHAGAVFVKWQPRQDG